MEWFEGIVEVTESRYAPEVSWYLEKGYELLRIDAVARSGRHPEGQGNGAGSYFVRRQMVYVLGRKADVTHCERPHESELPARTRFVADPD